MADDLFEQMVAEGHAAYTLSAMGSEAEPVTDRERDLVDAAVKAGVVGALTVLRKATPPTTP